MARAWKSETLRGLRGSAPQGDATIAAMTQTDYDEKMKTWERRISTALG